MNIAEAKQQIRDTVEAYLSRDDAGAPLIAEVAQRPVFLLGAPGIGKTAIVSQIADELGIGLVSYSMTHHTRQSALGLPVIVHKVYGDEEFDVSEYTMSEIIAAIYDYMERTGHSRGILFLDEINCVSETLYPSMLQFLQFKTFGRHKVPDGWTVVCAGNPPEYNKSVHDFDVVTLDRMRKLVVEPDMSAWLAYARETGVHPAITSYLEVRRDDFYIVESASSEKSFVTARGWDDLSKTIVAYEATGKAVGKALVSQFLQDDAVASRFAQYYALFKKYRGEYDVPGILRGEDSSEMLQRAQGSGLEERLTLVFLVADALNAQCQDVLETEGCAEILRDELRKAKACVADGASLRAELEEAASALREDVKRRVLMDGAIGKDVKPLRMAADRLEEYAEEAYAVDDSGWSTRVEGLYECDVQTMKDHAEACGKAMDNCFAFAEAAFGEGREVDVLVAEITGKNGTARFIAEFGNEGYYTNNGLANVAANRHRLVQAGWEKSWT